MLSCYVEVYTVLLEGILLLTKMFHRFGNSTPTALHSAPARLFMTVSFLYDSLVILRLGRRHTMMPLLLIAFTLLIRASELALKNGFRFARGVSETDG